MPLEITDESKAEKSGTKTPEFPPASPVLKTAFILKHKSPFTTTAK